MALKKLTTVLALLFCRFTLFFFFTVLFWILQGMPNINTCFLTIFLSYIVPLPSVSFLIHPIDRVLSHFYLVIRAYTVVVTKVQVIFVSLPYHVVHFLMYDWLENLLRYVINHIRFTTPQLVSKTSTKMFQHILPWLKTLHDLLRMSCLGVSFLSKCLVWMARVGLSVASRLCYKVIHLQMFFFFRKVLSSVFVTAAILMCLPGLEPLPNLLATGQLYPGSLIRFQRCAKYDDSTACHAAFLEFSYSVCNLIRTSIFITMCWIANRPSWKPPGRDLAMIVERCLALHDKTYSQLLLCAAGLPLLMKGHCFSQSVHNTVCIGNLLLFMVTLNGYHTRTASMMYHALCTVAMNAQSALVAVYNISRNLQTQRSDSIVTLLYIMELYLMLLVLLDSSARVINKVKNPQLDIMSQDS